MKFVNKVVRSKSSTDNNQGKVKDKKYDSNHSSKSNSKIDKIIIAIIKVIAIIKTVTGS